MVGHEYRPVAQTTRSYFTPSKMANNVLLTGASGYLGGDFLTQYQSAKLPNLSKLFALVRTDEQAEQVKKYGAIPLEFSLGDEAAVKKSLVENGINVVYYLIGAYHFDSQPFFLSALKEVKEKTGNEVHFLYVSRRRPPYENCSIC